MDDAPIGALATPLSRQQILDVTARCLREEGYDATTIRRIAAILGCAVGSIYRYFDDKRSLLDAVSQAELRPAADAAEAGEPVRETASLYSELAQREPAMYRLMFWLATVQSGRGQGAAAKPPPLPAVVRRIIDAWGHQLGGREAARQCWLTLHGAIMLGVSTEEALAMLAPQLERAVSAASTPSRRPADLSDATAPPPPRSRAAHRLFAAGRPVAVSPAASRPSTPSDADDGQAAQAASDAAAEEVVLL
jgi:AcrR family transcriptional regulator